MTEKERAKQLSSDHWGYVAGVIKVHGADEQTVAECGHHFVTAFEHGYKHAVEDERSGMFCSTPDALYERGKGGL